MKKLFTLMMALLLLVTGTVAFSSCGDKVAYIGVQTGTTGQYFVDGDADWGFDGIEGYESKGYSNGGLAVNDMKNGAVKYVIIDEQPAKQLVKKIDGVKVIDVALTEEEYAFGVDKENAELFTKMEELRETVDTLETLLPRKMWPFPTYAEILYSVK